MISESNVKIILREKGLCGHVYSVGIQRVACVLDRDHDNGEHEKGWTVSKRIVHSSYKHDEREPDDIFYDVKNCSSSMTFSTENQEHAEWLASTMTRLDL